MEDDPIRMFVTTHYRAALLALILSFCAAASHGQAPAPRQRPSQSKPAVARAIVPLRRYPMLGDSTYLPKDIAVRSTKGVTGFDKAKSRVRIGGDNGASVTEKVINITRTDVIDERVPVWSSDERFFFFAGNTADNAARYRLFRIITDEPIDANPAGAVPLTSLTDTAFDYYFPAINVNSSRIAFVRSSDGKLVDDPTKKWDLYVSDLPTGSGVVIDTDTLGPTNLRKLTEGRDFPDGKGGRATFTNVGRPAFIGSSDVVFAGQLSGDPNYHLFTVNIETRTIFQITSGPADERNPSVSPDGRYIAFDSNAQPKETGETYNNVGARLRSESDQAAVPAAALAAGSTRNVFTTTTLGQNVQQYTLRYAGAPLTTINSVQPTWSFANNANIVNPQGDIYYLGFSSNRVPQFAQGDTEQATVTGWAPGPNNTSSIYYGVISRDKGGSLLSENTPTDLNNLQSDGARRLDTANDTLVNGRLNDVTKPRYRDQYPNFAPFITVFRMGFQSNRNGNYSTDGFGNGFSGPTSATQNNLFIASFIDITAPTLIRFNTDTPISSVVNINLVTNPLNPFNPNANVRNRSDGITPGSVLYFAVRVEDRGTGLRPENSADGGAVYIQFKNPNSRYQTLQQSGSLDNSATRGEHKEFIESPYAWVAVVNNADFLWTLAATGYNVGQEFECQAISAANADNTNVNDPAFGTKYYSHFFNTFGTTGAQGSVYIPSFSDSFAFAGSSMPPLDGGAYNGSATPTANVWLRLKPIVELNADGTPRLDGNGNSIPVRPADGRGGVLYGAPWNIPTEASDWYMDVILYDNAVNPFAPSQRSNAIIYDNVWGFSSAPPISGQATDILFVSDYTLGQKFFSARFGTSPTDDLRSNNLSPVFWGSESYFTDTDLTRFPSERAEVPSTLGTGTPPPAWDKETPFQLSFSRAPGGVFGRTSNSGTPNVLGVEGYSDEITESGAVNIEPRPNLPPDPFGFQRFGPNYRLFPTSRYSIWRVLSRGAVPASLLQDYLPQITTSPADIAKGEDPTKPRTILSANRMVVWSSPFSGDLFVGAGAITDVQTQNNLTSYVQAGGRLFISGQDIAFALAGNGQNNAFFTNILKAQFLSDTSGLFTGLVGANPTGGNGYVQQLQHDSFDPAVANSAYGHFNTNPPWVYAAPDESAPGANAQLRYGNNEASANRVGDASFTAFSGLVSYIDRVRATPGTTPAGLPAGTPPDAVDVYLFPGSAAPPAFPAPGVAPAGGAQQSAMIASAYPSGGSPVGYDRPYNQATPFQPVGKVVYSPVGFETISQGWYNYTGAWATLGRRTEVMQNITDWFRTGTLTGRIIDNNGAPVNDALVRAIRNTADDTLPAAGTAVTDESGNFQIVGLQPGFYVIYGYKAGFYTQHNVGNSVRGGWRTATNLVLKTAGPGSLTGIKVAATQSQGGVFEEDGVTPIAGIEIQVRRLDSNGRYTLATAFSSDGRSSNLPAGAYEFPSLLTSTYQVLANATTTVVNGVIVPKARDGNGRLPGVNEAYLKDVRVGYKGPGDDNFHYTLGPGTTVVNVSDVFGFGVIIGEGQNAQINFQLPTSPQTVKGRVIDQDTKAGIKDAIVTAKRGDVLIASASTDENGNYTLARANVPAGQDPTLLPGGQYIITATANGYSSSVPPSEVNDVPVRLGGSTDPVVTAPEIRLKALPPGSLSGLVQRFIGTGKPTPAGAGGAVVTLYAVTTVNGSQVQAANPSYTVTVADTTTTVDNYTFNFKIDSVLPGTYNAYVSKPGLTGTPSPLSNVTVTSGTETRNVNFTLEPPKIYAEGIQLVSVPQDFSAIPTPSIFGVSENGDNNGDGIAGDAADKAIYDVFNVAEWTGTDYTISKTIPLRLGKGYFVRLGAQTAINAQGTPTNNSSFTVDLQANWNLIGHPFSNQTNPSDPAASIDINGTGVTYSYVANGVQRTNVTLAQAVNDGAVQSVAYGYSGSTVGNQYNQTTILAQWSGYWFRAFVPVQMTMQYPGAGRTRAVKEAMKNGKFQTVTRAMRETVTMRSIESKSATEWRVQIAARQGDLLDTDNSVGVAADGHEGFDNKYDNQKPPVMPDAPSLYLSVNGTDAAGRSVVLSDDIKSPGGTKTWSFSVQSNRTGEITVYWPNIARLPRGVEPTLIDEATGKRIAMRGGSSSFRFTPSGRAQRTFRIEVAPALSLPLDILNLRSTGGSRAVGGYQFRFTTTRAVDVNAELRTLTGRTVRRLQTRAAAGTETTLVWDGRDEGGSPPAPRPLCTARQYQRRNGSVRYPRRHLDDDKVT